MRKKVKFKMFFRLYYDVTLKFAYILCSDLKFQNVLRGIILSEFREKSLKEEAAKHINA